MKKTAFTLAEILITMAIIGVVAALTIPTLLNNIEANNHKSQLMKTMATLRNATKMSRAMYEVGFESAAKCNTLGDSPEFGITFCSLFNGTLTGATMEQTSLYPEGTELYNIPNPIYLTLADTSLVVFSADAHNCTLADGDVLPNVQGEHCVGYIDVNGPKMPNREVSSPVATSGMFVPAAFADNISTTIDGVPVSTGFVYVPKNASYMADIYPIVFHDSTVDLATPAGRAVFTNATEKAIKTDEDSSTGSSVSGGSSSGGSSYGGGVVPIPTPTHSGGSN